MKVSPALKALTAFVLVFATITEIRSLDQPLLEAHAFRQTQTALTAFWMMQDGWHLAYETPVAGYPWAIPFEFPLYQALAAAVAKAGGFPLDPVGRLLSYLFLLGCAWPATGIARRLALPEQVVWVFCALLWSSPLYLFWGRSFMIETAALFFACAAIPYALDLLGPAPRWSAVTGVAAFGTAATLQKATTGGPVIAILACVWLAEWLRRRTVSGFAIGQISKAMIGFGLPLLAGAAWTVYSDSVKRANPLGSQLTSAALGIWNFGTLEQRLSPSTYIGVVWTRVFVPNAGGLLGVALLVGVVVMPGMPRLRQIMLVVLTLFVAPILIFTNLHIAHDYYQTACALFLIAGLALAVGVWLPEIVRINVATPLVTCLLVVSNLLAFETGYGRTMRTPFLAEDNRTLAVAKVLRENTPTNSGFVAFGNDWSSTLAYYAQRKSFTVPAFFRNYDGAWKDPGRFLGPLRLGAIVTCPSREAPTREQADAVARSDATWVPADAADCRVLVRRHSATAEILAKAATPRLSP
jgi:hypothetical protein